MSNKEPYQCSSHMYDRACSNTLSVRQTLVESLIVDSLKADLLNPQIIAEVEKRCRQGGNKRRAPIGNSARNSELQAEVSNLTDRHCLTLDANTPIEKRRAALSTAPVSRWSSKR